MKKQDFDISFEELCNWGYEKRASLLKEGGKKKKNIPGQFEKHKTGFPWNKEKKGAELTTEKREELKPKQFAIPKEEKYPIHDLAHAKNALARVSQFGSPEEREAVRRKVYARYPELKEGFEERHGESPTSKENIKKEEQGNIGKEKEGACATPGKKIGSRGLGRGLARGAGKGPIGVPIQKKAQTVPKNIAKSPETSPEEMKKILALQNAMKSQKTAGALLKAAQNYYGQPMEDIGYGPAMDPAMQQELYNYMAQQYGEPTFPPPGPPEPMPGFMVQHPTMTAMGGGLAGGLLGAGLGYGAGGLVGGDQSQNIGSTVGAGLGALLGSALGSSMAEQAEEDYSEQLADYLSKISSITAQKKSLNKEAAEPENPDYRIVYAPTPEEVIEAERAEAKGKKIGKGLGKAVSTALWPIRAITKIPRMLLFPRELEGLRDMGAGLKGTGEALGGATARGITALQGGGKIETMPYVSPSRTLALTEAARIKSMVPGAPSLPGMVESPTAVVR